MRMTSDLCEKVALLQDVLRRLDLRVEIREDMELLGIFTKAILDGHGKRAVFECESNIGDMIQKAFPAGHAIYEYIGLE